MPYKRDYILQKRPIIWSILLNVATQYANGPVYTQDALYVLKRVLYKLKSILSKYTLRVYSPSCVQSKLYALKKAVCTLKEPYVQVEQRDMSHSFVWRDSSIRVTWLIHTCDMTHLCV